MDVKTAFLHSELAELIYIEIPEGLGMGEEEENSPKKVCPLIKTIYGLKQAPRAWYGKINDFFSENGFIRSNEDHSLFIHEFRSLIILLYVDDLILAATTQNEINWAKGAPIANFEMTELGVLTGFIRVDISRDRERQSLKISQKSYVSSVLEEHGMEGCAPVSTPVEPGLRLEKSPEGYESTPKDHHRYQSAVGSLMYAMLGTRPDIAYAVGLVTKFPTNPHSNHWGAVKRIFQYLPGTWVCLCFPSAVSARSVFRPCFGLISGISNTGHGCRGVASCILFLRFVCI